MLIIENNAPSIQYWWPSAIKKKEVYVRLAHAKGILSPSVPLYLPTVFLIHLATSFADCP